MPGSPRTYPAGCASTGESCPAAQKYTRSHPALALEAAWRAADRSAASKLEAQLKRRSHAEKLALIAHPEQLADYVPLDAAALAAAWASTT